MITKIRNKSEEVRTSFKSPILTIVTVLLYYVSLTSLILLSDYMENLIFKNSHTLNGAILFTPFYIVSIITIVYKLKSLSVVSLDNKIKMEFNRIYNDFDIIIEHYINSIERKKEIMNVKINNGLNKDKAKHEFTLSVIELLSDLYLRSYKLAEPELKFRNSQLRYEVNNRNLKVILNKINLNIISKID